MAYNKARAEKEWLEWKSKEETQLRELGVDEDTIQFLHTYDWEMFKADRNYRQRHINIGTIPEIVSEDSSTTPRSVEDFLDNIEDERLYRLLREVDSQTLQMLFLKSLGYTAKEIEQRIGMPESMVHNRISRLRKKYKKEIRLSYKKVTENNGISGNLNASLKLAMGEYVLFAGQEIIPEPDVLFQMVKAITEKKADMIYTDEDEISADGKHYSEPEFKPDFNLFRLRENNYIGQFWAIRKEILEQAGKFDPEYDGAQDYDMLLRCSEQAENIVHIPKILCHSMKAENLITEEQEKKNWEAGRKALEEHYRRAEVSATAELADKKGWYRSHLTISGEPMISVIIPSKDHINDLELCISSIEEKTTWKNYEIIIVENNSVEKETFVYYETLKNRYPNVRILTWKKEFNYSAINNFAVREARGEYLLFLNNDVEIITESWLEEMLQLCQQKDVGMVGAKLYYPDDTIQHAGVVVGLGGVAAHVLCKLPRDAEGYMGRLRCVQEISAVTAACMMVKTSVFKAVGGFDEELKVAFNDIDLCMKVRKYGVKIVFTPYAELYHYESKSRGMEDTPEKQLRFSREVNCFRRKWERELLKGDPYYNPNLTLNNTDCSLRKQEKNGD